MDIKGSRILILGGSGLVGLAVARQLLEQRPTSLVIAGLTRAEAEEGVDSLREHPRAGGVEIIAEWGDVFLRHAFREQRRSELIRDPESRRLLLDDLYGPLTPEMVEASALGTMLDRHCPELIVDCVNTATVVAYQNVYRSALGLRERIDAGTLSPEDVEEHLATHYLPQLIRHVQIALDSMRRARTRMYVKIGTAGTGGMGLNIPFTHSEERPSRVLLAKSSLAGAHSLLLFLMARTPGAPAVKEIKPTAAISWKRIGVGDVRRGGQPIRRMDSTGPVPLAEALGEAGDDSGFWEDTGEKLRGVYLDAGENGMFSPSEFETLTSLGLMEFITPEEIARDVIREVTGHPTGHDIVAALDASTSGPTYRAGVLRQSALDRMDTLEREEGVRSVAYEMLGPPRLSKLLFEAEILSRLNDGDLHGAAGRSGREMAEASEKLVTEDRDLRTRILSIGLPILLPDGKRLLRGPVIKVRPETRDEAEHDRLSENGWVDLRPSNWERWRVRASTILHESGSRPGPDAGSGWDGEAWHEGGPIRPGVLAAWIFRNEDRGKREKR